MFANKIQITFNVFHVNNAVQVLFNINFPLELPNNKKYSSGT